MEHTPRCLLIATLLLTVPPLAAAEPAEEQSLAYEDRIAELERTVAVLADELERTRREVVVPEETGLESVYGLGPAASKVYDLTRGLSIGGYGELNYEALVNDQGTARNTADALRGVLYFGYKFTDSIVFNSEIEIEHADEIALEFATLDFLFRDWLNVRTGLMLLPIGFLNEIHEPPFFYGVNRPDVERVIIPSTWAENGVGIFGSLGESLHYKLYAVNGMDASGFSASGLRGGRQGGGEALAEDIAFAGRVDWAPLPGTLVGVSAYHGKSGQNQALPMLGGGATVGFPDVETTLFDVHAQLKHRGLHLRGLFTMAFLDNAALLTAARAATDASFSGAIAEQMLGGYAEIAYDLWPFFSESERSFEPFYRFEHYDTQYRLPDGFLRDRSKRIDSHTIGFNFKPIPNVVIKADYRNRDADLGRVADELNLGVGYVF